jgi:hypothetical protein
MIRQVWISYMLTHIEWVVIYFDILLFTSSLVSCAPAAAYRTDVVKQPIT